MSLMVFASMCTCPLLTRPYLSYKDLTLTCNHWQHTVVLVAHKDSRVSSLKSMLQQLAVALQRAEAATLKVSRPLISALSCLAIAAAAAGTRVAQHDVDGDQGAIVVVLALREAPAWPDSVELNAS